MNVIIDKSRIEDVDIESLRSKCGAALDRIWTENWVKKSINKTDRDMIAGITELAEQIAGQCGTAVVIAAGDVGSLIRAALAAVPTAPDKPDVRVMGESFSSETYSREIKRLEKEDFVLIGITEGKESLEETAAFAVMKKLLIEKYGQTSAADRVYIMAGKASETLAQEASENDFHTIRYPEDMPPQTGADSEAVLFPLAVKGADIDSYLDGFEQMLASPIWDADGVDYAAAKSQYRRENFLIWQNQLEAFGKWAAAAPDGREKRMCVMPEEKALADKTFDTVILAAEDSEDIMTPFFAGCNEDGSLNLLLQERACRHFDEGKGKAPGVKITIEQLDEYSVGQLFAFVQLSNRITEFLLNN